jgi:copper chaperone NosL
MNGISRSSRIILGVASLSVISTLFLPLWQIQLWAPQYPEGLNMKIWHNKLSGAFDIINGLNHYIGMREIKAEMFPEFHFLGILILLFAAIGLVSAWRGTRRWLIVFVGTSLVYGMAALYDFYRWGYDYGHNLDEHAAIKVPGMAYQPPVVGYKNLLNFTAYSGPDLGGWIIIVVSAIAMAILCGEWFLNKRKASKTQYTVVASLLAITVFTGLFSCNTGPEPIKYGSDACYGCKMSIMDHRFGSELITEKGKVYKFDDLNCLVSCQHKNCIGNEKVSQIVVVDFNHVGKFIDINKAFFIQSDKIKSPMRADIAAFETIEERDQFKQTIGDGTLMSWDQVLEQF